MTKDFIRKHGEFILGEVIGHLVCLVGLLAVGHFYYILIGPLSLFSVHPRHGSGGTVCGEWTVLPAHLWIHHTERNLRVIRYPEDSRLGDHLHPLGYRLHGNGLHVVGSGECRINALEVTLR